MVPSRLSSGQPWRPPGQVPCGILVQPKPSYMVLGSKATLIRFRSSPSSRQVFRTSAEVLVPSPVLETSCCGDLPEQYRPR